MFDQNMMYSRAKIGQFVILFGIKRYILYSFSMKMVQFCAILPHFVIHCVFVRLSYKLWAKNRLLRNRAEKKQSRPANSCLMERTMVTESNRFKIILSNVL